MVNKISRRTKSVLKNLLRIKQEKLEQAATFQVFLTKSNEGKLQFLPRPLRKRRKIDYAVVLLFAMQEPQDMADLVSDLCFAQQDPNSFHLSRVH